MMRFPKSLVLFFFCIALLQNCQSGDGTATDPGVTDEEIVVGGWGPLTGPAALWGNVVLGMDAYFKMINEEGGIHGRKINFVLKDDGYDPSKTVAVVREIVQRNEIFAAVGGVGTAPNMSVRDFLEENNIPWISPISGATHWAYPPRENVFSTFPLYFDEAEVHVNYCVQELGVTKFGIIYQNDDFGRSGLVGAENALKNHGLEFAAAVSTETTDADLASHAARLKESGAEVVFLWVLPRQAAIILGTSAVTGFNPQWMACSALSDMTLMHQITNGAWEGVVFTSLGKLAWSDDPLVLKYKAAMAKYYPDTRWGTFALAGFGFAEPFIEGLRIAGPDLTRTSLVQAMESLSEFEGVGNKISFGPGLRQGTRSSYLVRCLGPETYEVVTEPQEAASDVQSLIEALEH